MVQALGSGEPLTSLGSGVQRSVLPWGRRLACKARGTVRLLWGTSTCAAIPGKGWGEASQVSLCEGCAGVLS